MKNQVYRLIIGILILVLAVGTVVTATTSAATCPVSVTYIISADWGTGYTLNMVVRNITPTTIPGGWKLSWTLAGDQKIIYPTPPIIVQTGSDVTYTAPLYMSIPPNGSANIGFSVSGTGRGISNMKFNGIPVGGLMQ